MKTKLVVDDFFLTKFNKKLIVENVPGKIDSYPM